MVTAACPPTATSSIPHPLGNVLLAEDDLDLLSSYLRRRGHRVFCVRDGAALVQRVDEASPRGALPPIDVTVSDVFMPGLDGLTAIDEVHEAGRPIPVILMTAFGSRELHDRGRRQGALVVLDKPFELEQLLSAVDVARFGRPA